MAYSVIEQVSMSGSFSNQGSHGTENKASNVSAHSLPFCNFPAFDHLI
jgi:hypothetical protein